MHWNDWLNAFVNTPYGSISRKSMLTLFVKDGLYPFMTAQGYTWASDVNGVKSALATGMFLNQSKPYLSSDWSRVDVLNTDHMPEDKDHYDHVMDRELWWQFWQMWGHWDDVIDDSLHMRYQIEAFVWTQLDIGGSAQTATVNLLFEEEGQQEEGDNHRRHDDVYIREAAESNEWGGYRR